MLSPKKVWCTWNVQNFPSQGALPVKQNKQNRQQLLFFLGSPLLWEVSGVSPGSMEDLRGNLPVTEVSLVHRMNSYVGALTSCFTHFPLITYLQVSSNPSWVFHVQHTAGAYLWCIRNPNSSLMQSTTQKYTNTLFKYAPYFYTATQTGLTKGGRSTMRHPKTKCTQLVTCADDNCRLLSALAHHQFWCLPRLLVNNTSNILYSLYLTPGRR